MTHKATSARIGQPVRRKEDLRLVTGKGCYTDDINLPGQAYAVMVRSPHAHARIGAINVAPGMAIPGVLAVLTGRDLLADGLQPIPHKVWSQHPAELMLREREGFKTFTAPHYALPADKARFAGEAVAMVIADTAAAAKDGAERVAIDYEVLPAVTDTLEAARADAPRLFEKAGSNVVVDGELGDRAATEAAFARAAHVVKFETQIQRVTGVPMEPRAAVCEFDPHSQRYTLYAGNGGAWRLKDDLATTLGVPSDQVRVIMHDVGGNFGTRGMIYAEFALVAWAARRLGRPVKWTAERHESFLCDYQARDLAVTAELAIDQDGNFLGLRGSNISNAGAHTTNYSPLQKGVEIMTTVYRIPAAYFRARAVVSNTSPTRPYRSAGRPEVMFVMERLIDLACREHGFDRVEIRRRNLVKDGEFPYKNALGMVYDSGAYHHTMNWALKLGDWAGFPERRAAARACGRHRGIAVANYIDTATGVARERTEMTVRPDGWIDVVIGTTSQGQGHETSFAQLVNEWYGVPIENVRVITHDTDIVKFGGGAHSGRGMRLASLIMWKATQAIIARGKQVAALLLQSKPEAIEFAGGRFMVSGRDQGIGLFDVSAAMLRRADLPEDLRGPLAATCDEIVSEASFPFGSHVCEVEIDPDLGACKIVKYSAVDDVGRAVNPLIVDGQTHGGIVQGLGQALFEQCFYDRSSGQLLSGSFMDYAMPRADMLPFFDTGISEVPMPSHPLGIRPAGEGGTTPALAVTVNAIVDALRDFGVRHVEMPATPERIWRAMRGLPRPPKTLEL
ncbi:MAG TPA: xanthine dehydrogenase family protein molybdopterin-binding subunit [Xanthobacteraceae bacterium]|jgi:carbon-monoxide dehydrogenase large subunit|nr:xanthine dehydrogenase family protein molybdopterin-binding subunit [Xanthobacteraceae bacterium]